MAVLKSTIAVLQQFTIRPEKWSRTLTPCFRGCFCFRTSITPDGALPLRSTNLSPGTAQTCRSHLPSHHVGHPCRSNPSLAQPHMSCCDAPSLGTSGASPEALNHAVQGDFTFIAAQPLGYTAAAVRPENRKTPNLGTNESSEGGARGSEAARRSRHRAEARAPTPGAQPSGSRSRAKRRSGMKR